MLSLARVPDAGAADASATIAAGSQEVQSVLVHIPAQADSRAPIQVLVVLHGFGGEGEAFSRDLASLADANGWLIVAPTIQYGDWTDPNQVANEDPALIAWLSDYLDQLPATTGLPLAPKAMLMGHSRGAQLALRFAEFHPEQVRSVAALSAGTYTLPVGTDGSGRTLAFPYGVGDLATRPGGRPFNLTRFRQVTTWIGVGSDDANPNDVPRAWDAYLGTTRLARAQAYSDLLRQLGARVSFHIFPGATHAATPEMKRTACLQLDTASVVDSVVG